MSVEKIAKIERTSLGYEDHGIFTAMLHVTYGGTSQGIGGIGLDEPSGERTSRGRRGTAFGMEWIARCIKACGVQTWEEVKGRTIIVLFAEDVWSAMPIGIKPLPTEPGEEFRFSVLADEYYPERRGVA